MVTGDNKATAEAVCRDIGAMPETPDSGDKAPRFLSLTGAEWERLSANEKARGPWWSHVATCDLSRMGRTRQG